MDDLIKLQAAVDLLHDDEFITFIKDIELVYLSNNLLEYFYFQFDRVHHDLLYIWDMPNICKLIIFLSGNNNINNKQTLQNPKKQTNASIFCQLISLKLPIDLFSNPEFSTFVQLFGRTFFTEFLLKYFDKELKQSDNIQDLDDVITVIQDIHHYVFEIIASRTEISSDLVSMNNNNNKLDELPIDIFFKITSFLDFKAILKFERCNKRIFICVRSTYSPNQFSLTYFRKCMEEYNHKWCDEETHSENCPFFFLYYLNRYRSLKQLCLDMNDCFDYDSNFDVDGFEDSEYSFDIPLKISKYYQFPYILFDNLESLTILGKKQLNVTRDIQSLHHFIDELSECYLSNIKTFRFIDPYFGESICDKYFIEHLLEMMSQQTIIQYIEIYLDEASLININGWTERLKGIAIQTNDTALDTLRILEKVGDKLESLHLNSSTALNMDCNYKLYQLKEVCLCESAISDIDILLTQNLTNLKRVYFEYENISYHITDEHIKSIELLFKLKSLNYIDIGCSANNINLMMQILINSLKNTEKETLKIRFGYDHNTQNLLNKGDSININVYDILLLLIQHLLNSTKHFMVIWDFKMSGKHHVAMNVVFNKLKSKYMINIEQGRNGKFVICDRNCVIKRFEKEWLMKCRNCDHIQNLCVESGKADYCSY